MLKQISQTLDNIEPNAENLRELIGYNIKLDYNNLGEIRTESEKFRQFYIDQGHDLEHKQMMEAEHYKKLEGSLLHSIAENKYYLKQEIMKSRRFVALSSDCISVIQVEFRPEGTYLGVYFRSSHFDQLLPVDLDFLYTLLIKTVQYIESRKGTETFDDVDQDMISRIKNNPVQVNLTFGSLHKN